MSFKNTHHQHKHSCEQESRKCISAKAVVMTAVIGPCRAYDEPEPLLSGKLAFYQMGTDKINDLGRSGRVSDSNYAASPDSPA